MMEKDFMDASFQDVLTKNNVSFCVMKNLFYLLMASIYFTNDQKTMHWVFKAIFTH